ncbi:radical SAM protein [Candidatus Bathyarchaeota archaeon]|nr:radical SAM protein [Candidatus Bathyarchaeota archaeon]
MKVSISYPPIEGSKGIPLLSQNRQFQYFSEPTYIYPMVPAYAASLLKEAGYDVVWDDAIAEEMTYQGWLSRLGREAPDVAAIETKTPVVKKHWRIIGDIKEESPHTKVVMFGDHVTALPRESMENSKVDYVIEGGDYDFLLLNLVKFLDGKVKELEPGFWFREYNEIRSTGSFHLNHDLNSLPFIDRDLTRWRLYSEKNGNFKNTPGTYTMAGRDCWWRKNGGCIFCSWPTLYPIYRVRKPELLVEEIGTLIEKYNIREIFDDTGSFPVGNWLKKFTGLMIERGYNEKIWLNCNMRFGALTGEDYGLMRKAGFRMLLFGLESASQRILDQINKGVRVEEITDSCRKAKEAGLMIHITIMFGYPNASREEEFQTYQLAKKLMDEGYVDTLQSTLLIPYPGSKLYEMAVENGWLRYHPGEWEHWDMSEPVLKSSDISPEEVKQLCDQTYKLFMSRRYALRKLLSIRSLEDLKFSLRGVRKVAGHIKDFK